VRRRPGAHWIELQCASGIFGFTAVAAHIAWVRDVPPDVLEESFFIRFPQSAGGDVTAAERG